MKKAISTLAVILLICVLPVGAVLSAGFLLPPQFDETYFGELGAMYHRLYTTQGKKIVIIGNSNVAFGIRSDLIESGLPDYTVVNFGLYGAIGTRAMLDLSRGALREGDVVVIAPEQYDQSLSLYFSGADLWKAVDGSFSVLFSLPEDDAKMMFGSFPAFAQSKYESFASGQKPALEGVYQRNAFERDGFEVGFMTCERPYNMMAGGYDPNNLVYFDTGMIGDGFFDFLNAYYEYAWSKGAKVFFSFSPMNRLALSADVTDEKIEQYYDCLLENLNFPIMGDPHSYIFDYEWFYDNNCHMNSAGMFLYTRQMLEDIKGALGISTPTNIAIPEKPAAPPPVAAVGDSTGQALFTYADTADGLMITGLTTEGAEKTSVTIPAAVDGRPVVSFTPETFAGSERITSITIPASVRILYDGSFDGCTHLTSLILEHTSPSSIGVGASLLTGAPSCRVYVASGVLGTFSTHYSWSMYEEVLRGY